MADPANGLVMVAVHEVFCPMDGFTKNMNVLAVVAVRVGAIIAVKASARKMTSDWQGEAR